MAVLHLAHPDAFDPIVSADHKHWITTRFADVAGTSPDVDRRLLSIRDALTPEYGEGFDWYDWLVRLWWKNGKDWKSFLRWLEHSRANADRPAPETGQLLESGDETFFADGIIGIRQAWQLAGSGAEATSVCRSSAGRNNQPAKFTWNRRTSFQRVGETRRGNHRGGESGRRCPGLGAAAVLEREAPGRALPRLPVPGAELLAGLQPGHRPLEVHPVQHPCGLPGHTGQRPVRRHQLGHRRRRRS